MLRSEENHNGDRARGSLYIIGIRQFEDPARYTPQDLSKALLEQVCVKVPSERIEANTGSARELAQQANTEHTPSEEEAEVAKEPEEALPMWRQHAGFSVFFDYMTDEHGEQVWQVRVYHDESGEEVLLPGIEIAPWVNWILERAKLPVPKEPTPTEAEVSAPPAPVTSYDAGIEILDVQLRPSSCVREKRLIAEVRFQISGPEAKTLTADRIPFRIEVHTINLESGALNLVVSERNQLKPQVFEYTSQQAFPLPELGRYRLHSIVLLLPPGEMMASHRGPTIKVVP